MTQEQLKKDIFDYWGNNASSWKRCAIDLLLASEVIFANFATMEFNAENGFDQDHIKFSGILAPAIMLQGYAIEAALKANWIAQGKVVALNGQYKISAITKDNHDLVRIAKELCFPLLPDEDEVLERLTLYTTSLGRYPVTKSSTKYPVITRNTILQSQSQIPLDLKKHCDTTKIIFERLIVEIDGHLRVNFFITDEDVPEDEFNGFVGSELTKIV